MTQLGNLAKWCNEHRDVTVRLDARNELGMTIDMIDRFGRTLRRVITQGEADATISPLTWLLDFMYEELMEAKNV